MLHAARAEVNAPKQGDRAEIVLRLTVLLISVGADAALCGFQNFCTGQNAPPSFAVPALSACRFASTPS